MINMISKSSKIYKIIDIARYAPSVHNTQPWKITANDNRINIGLDSTYLLKYGDPTGRQTVISLGIFSESIKIAAESLGFSVKITYVNRHSVCVDLKIKPNNKPAKSISLVNSLKSRATDRSIYKPVVISNSQLKLISEVPHSKSVTIFTSTDPKLIESVADLTSRGIGVAISNPEFRKELSGYLIRNTNKKNRGISVMSLYIPKPIAIIEPWLLKRGIGMSKEVSLEKKRWLSASGLVIITAKGDLDTYWFDVGKAYLQASLEIEALGLSQATSAAIVEATNYHDDIEEILGTSDRILAIMRIGQGSKKRHYSPRVSVDDLTT